MRERVRMWAGVVFELLEVLERLAGRIGDRRDKRSGQRFRGAGLWRLVRVLAQVFAVFRCWFYVKKSIKDCKRRGQKTRETRQQKSEKSR